MRQDVETMDEDMALDRPIPVAEGIFWIGFRDEEARMGCNPYLVVQDGEAILIDTGSRTDFAVVMMKVLQAGIDPSKVVALIYQHYDPDLCGSMPNFMDMCDHPGLKILSAESNNLFISYYIHREKRHLLESIESRDFAFAWNGRVLRFIPTPFAHNAGSFVTYDEKTRTLFSSDLFGGYASDKELFLKLDDRCFSCREYDECPQGKTFCPLKDILVFHQRIMPCCKALRYAMARIQELDIRRIAPQHGHILNRSRDIAHVTHQLAQLEGVGIDAIA